jgi:hypothetical protein
MTYANQRCEIASLIRVKVTAYKGSEQLLS